MVINNMKHYILTIVFDEHQQNVLMCYHNKQKLWNFIGGTIEDGENSKEASYRELQEETGICPDDITLFTVREEIVRGSEYLYDCGWKMLVTYGILERVVELKEEKNHLEWIPISDRRIDDQSFGFGNCRVFLNEALEIIHMD